MVDLDRILTQAEESLEQNGDLVRATQIGIVYGATLHVLMRYAGSDKSELLHGATANILALMEKSGTLNSALRKNKEVPLLETREPQASGESGVVTHVEASDGKKEDVDFSQMSTEEIDEFAKTYKLTAFEKETLLRVRALAPQGGEADNEPAVVSRDDGQLAQEEADRQNLFFGTAGFSKSEPVIKDDIKSS